MKRNKAMKQLNENEKKKKIENEKCKSKAVHAGNNAFGSTCYFTKGQ